MQISSWDEQFFLQIMLMTEQNKGHVVDDAGIMVAKNDPA